MKEPKEGHVLLLDEAGELIASVPAKAMDGYVEIDDTRVPSLFFRELDGYMEVRRDA
jgi:hypothetical protein